MGRSLLALAVHHIDAHANLFIGHVQTELTAQYGPELCLVLQVTPISLTRRVAYGHAPIKHCDARSIRAWTRHYDVALIRRIRMRAGIPVRDLVFTVVPRIWDHAIDMFPRIAQLCL